MSEMYRRNLKRRESARRALNNVAQVSMQKAGTLAPESQTERTFKVSQREIRKEVATGSARNAWSRGGSGCVAVSTTHNGRFGVACFEAETVVMDLFRQEERAKVCEPARDACFLQDESMFAVAQRQYVYVYDNNGVEVHRMPQHLEPEHLEYLRYHFLLASCGHSGYLKYHDVSTGQLVSQHKAKRALTSFRNPQRATISLGHANGVVSFWSPAQPKALAKVLCHRAAASAGACAFDGTYFATGSIDEGTVKFWDLRVFGKPLHRLGKPPTSLTMSQRGMLAVAHSAGVDVYDEKKPRLFKPYLSHRSGNAVTAAYFRPFEDVLLLATPTSLDSILVPGAGEPNYDDLEGHNPYRRAKARKAQLVSSLLDKLPPETITLDSVLVGAVTRDPAEIEKHRIDSERDANIPTNQSSTPKRKTRGRSKIAARLRKKAKNVISAETEKLRTKLQAEGASALAAKRHKRGASPGGDQSSLTDVTGLANPKRMTASALDRLFRS